MGEEIGGVEIIRGEDTKIEEIKRVDMKEEEGEVILQVIEEVDPIEGEGIVGLIESIREVALEGGMIKESKGEENPEHLSRTPIQARNQDQNIDTKRRIMVVRIRGQGNPEHLSRTPIQAEEDDHSSLK